MIKTNHQKLTNNKILNGQTLRLFILKSGIREYINDRSRDGQRDPALANEILGESAKSGSRKKLSCLIKKTQPYEKKALLSLPFLPSLNTVRVDIMLGAVILVTCIHKAAA